jgi:hypothetical protein
MVGCWRWNVPDGGRWSDRWLQAWGCFHCLLTSSATYPFVADEVTRLWWRQLATSVPALDIPFHRCFLLRQKWLMNTH